MNDKPVGEAVLFPGFEEGVTVAVFNEAEVPVGTKLYARPQPAAPQVPEGWRVELQEAMAHCVCAADEGEDYAVSREMLNVLTTLGLMQKVGRGKWSPTKAGIAFASQKAARTLPIDVYGEWYEVPIPVHTYVVSLRERLATPPAPEQPKPAGDVEALIAACVPGGSICDPQAVADNIRAYMAAQPAQGEGEK